MIAAWAGALLAASLKGSLLLAVAWAATRWMRRSPAAARHLVWSAALAGMLLLPVLERVVPALPALPALPAPTLRVGPVWVDAPADPVVAEPAPVVAVASREPSAAPVAGASEPVPAFFDLLSLLPFLWLAGAALVLARLLAGVLGVWWLGRRATMVVDGGWLALAHDLAHRLGLTRGVTLLRGDRDSVPMTWGVLQPVVWLPAEADGWTPERRRVVLAHELAHVRRRDALTQWIAHLAVAAHWFNPLVWMAARRLREERERACDDAVLRVGTGAADYADHLLQIVRGLGERQGPVAAMAMARRSQFEGRLLAILDGAAARGGVPRRAAALTALLLLAALPPMAALRAGEPAPAAPSAAPVAAQTASFTATGSAPEADRQAEAATPRPLLVAPAADTIPRPLAAEETATLLAVIDEIQSDGDRASLLIRAARLPTASPALLREVVRSARAIESDGDLHSVLRTVLGRPNADASVLAAALEATAGMSSDGDQAAVLHAALPRLRTGEPALRAALFAALGRIDSSGDRAAVLSALFDRPALDLSMLSAALAAVPAMDSDGDEAAVLGRALSRYPRQLQGPLRDDFLRAARGISSDSDRASVLRSILEKPAADQGERLLTGTHELVGTHEGRPAYTLDLRARGVRLTPDGRGVAGLAAGGSLRVEHLRHPDDPDPDPLLGDGERRSLLRRLEVSGGGDDLRFDYRVDGTPRPWDAEGRAWLARVLRKLPQK